MTVGLERQLELQDEFQANLNYSVRLCHEERKWEEERTGKDRREERRGG